MTCIPGKSKKSNTHRHEASALGGRTRYQDLGLLNNENAVLLTEGIVEGNVDEAVGVTGFRTNDPLSAVLGVEANTSALCIRCRNVNSYHLALAVRQRRERTIGRS
jgi:hypothetical protein